MKIIQEIFSDGIPSPQQLDRLAAIAPQLLLVFWGAEPLEQPVCWAALKQHLPNALIAGCSTAGEIESDGVREGAAVATAIHFESAQVGCVETRLDGLADSEAAGRRLGRAIPGTGLRGVVMLAPGLNINGTAVIDGLAAELPSGVSIAGGLAGDNGAFACTNVMSPSGIASDKLVLIGFYGERVQWGAGSGGGWSAFGPTRRITRAEGSRLFELDGQPALALYKKYLGEYARDLPAAGLLFPFEMLDDQKKSTGLLRTILGIDESSQSLLLAGTVENGAYLRLMHASTDALVDGAEGAAAAGIDITTGRAGLALLISCVGRKLVMGDRIDEEVLAVRDRLGAGFTLSGFYSYGEVSPLHGLLDCRLHNQTMTIALISES